MRTKLFALLVVFVGLVSSCMKDEETMTMPLNPDTAGDVSIDRFGPAFAHLFMRDASNNFPAANQPVDFDAIPAFNTRGLGPNGEKSIYYNFDVLSTTPAPIYVLFREGESAPVSGQLNIVNVVPGDAGYNDFWLVEKVTVPKDYVANTVTSYEEIYQTAYPIAVTTSIVNCPIVPKGSVARKRFLTTESSELTRGWYKNKVVYYFNFFEKELMAVNGKVPTSDIFVCFNINPGAAGGGPASGFKTEDMTAAGQTHNIPETLPTDAAYSPLWDVQIYNNSGFASVNNLASISSVNILATDAAIVNCPIVWVQK